MIHVIDLNFLNVDQAIASYLIESDEGPILIECGPYSTFEQLKKGLSEYGYEPKDIRHVLLTHIHFDHAGAAWALAEHGAKIYTHPLGAPHMADPTKLYDSAKRIYQDEMERLWGEMHKIPEDQIIAPEDQSTVSIGDKNFKVHYTPGHAKHHIAWQLDEYVFTGDVAGVKIENGPVQPPCPPPDISLEEWNESIQKLLEMSANKLYLTHYGLIEDKHNHLAHLKEMLNNWAYWVKERWEAGESVDEMLPAFMSYTADQLRSFGVNDHGIQQYEAANPSWMSVSGLVRYWTKKAKG